MSRVPGRSLKEVARWPLTDKPRRFTPPWDIEDNGACFIVRDHSVSRLGQALSRQRPRKPLARSGRGKNTAWTLQRNHQGLAVGELAMERTNAGSPVAPPRIGRSSVIEPRLSSPSSPPSPLPKTRRTFFLSASRQKILRRACLRTPAHPNLVLAAAVKRCSIELNCALCRRHMAWFGAARKR